MQNPSASSDLVTDELEVLCQLVPLEGARVIELGCGAARMGRALLQRFSGAELVGLEVDVHQQAKNFANPQERLRFVSAGAQEIPFPDAQFDVALMLKSLHHVPLDLMAQALGEVARVLRPGGYLYVSEPVYAGALNEVVRLYNDEGPVRAAAQAAVDAALRGDKWIQVAERRFDMPARFADFAEFEQRMMRPTFVDHHLDDALVAKVRAAYEPHQGADGARFTRPMLVRLLQRT
jgi:SAM-dependent methyltransferase